MAKRSRYAHPILYGTLVVGTLDLLDAFIFFGVRSGVAPGRVLQSIAAGVYGRHAARMGIHGMGAGPLSATTRGAFAAPVFVNGLLIHAFGVGLPSAWFARE